MRHVAEQETEHARGPIMIGGIQLSHPDRILDAESGLTKMTLAHHYEMVASWMLPHVAKRPLALLRCPQGRAKTCFFQKQYDSAFPRAVRPVRVPLREGTTEHVYISDLAGLIALVQHGALEIHTWACHVDRTDRPDLLTFDLDPGDHVTWEQMKETAFFVRERLASLHLQSFVKTTGGQGLHVVVPIERRSDWETTSTFVRAFAAALARQRPEQLTNRAGRERRPGRIYLDYRRNDRGATAIAPYSTRARPGAPVALPIDWDELRRLSEAPAFTTVHAAKRVSSGTDPWRELPRTRQSIAASLVKRL